MNSRHAFAVVALAVLVAAVLGCRTSEDPKVAAQPQGAIVDASTDARSEASTDAEDAARSSGDGAASSAAASGVGCTQSGRACSMHCADLAAKYLAIAPDGSSQCAETTCSAAGGHCGYGGFCFGQTCIKKTSDGGRPCTDGTQCESRACLAPSSAKTGPGGGACSPIVFNSGCHAWVNHGVIDPPMCAD